MKTRHTLLCGIAFLALTGAALAQTDSTTTQSGEPAAHHAKHHHARMAVSGPQYSTPAEKAATDRLNEQQLQQAEQSLSQLQAAASPNQTTGPATPNTQPTDAQPSADSLPQNNGQTPQ